MSGDPAPMLRLSAQDEGVTGSADTFEVFFEGSSPRLFTAMWLVTGWPVGTFVRGARVMWQGEILGSATGEPVRFFEAGV